MASDSPVENPDGESSSPRISVRDRLRRYLDQGKGKPKSVWLVAAEFAGHIVAASFVLIVIGLAAVLISKFTHWLDSLHDVDQWVITIFKSLEYLVFALDAASFALYACVTTCFFMYELVTRRRS